jgi:BirA family transcriptional regulator, biotin operon repressor / biotin---[acetyl-CoA-carboxylase] ligase
MNGTDPIVPDEITAGLRTKIIGVRLVHVPETDSTNTMALAHARDGCPDGTVITADSQTSGRGRMDRAWFSPPGAGIYLSVVLRPDASLKGLPRLTLAAAVAAAEALEESAGVRADIKWPNDLLLNDKKVCGILTELHTGGEVNTLVIIGIGINVNTPAGSFPEDIAGIATSILAETGRRTSRADIIRSLLGFLDRYYDMFLRGEFPAILEKWKSRSSMIGKRVTIDQAGALVTGTVMGIDGEGALILRDDEGRVQTLYSGEVLFPA